MYKKSKCLVWLVLMFGVSSTAPAADYYISPSGDDSKAGTSAQQAWKSIDKVNLVTFQPGDKVLFEGGKTFKGSLRFDSADSGTADEPVTVGSYDKGRATISSGRERGLYAHNCGGVVVRDLVFVGAGRRHPKGRSGICFFTNRSGGEGPEFIRIDNVQVSGYRWEGIMIRADKEDNGFKDVRITSSTVFDNGDKGICAGAYYAQPIIGWAHKNFYIGNCKVYDNLGIANKKGHSGNGIVLSQVDGAVIEFCVAYNNGELCGDPNSGGPIGIWAWDSHDVVIQFCEAYDNKTGNKKDGGGFDLDGGCADCVMQYNYSHGNYGAGYGIYQYNGAREFKNNVVRYNISENDGLDGRYGGINIWSTNSSGGIRDTKIYNNTVYVSADTKGAAIAELPHTKGTSYVYNTEIYNNIFLAAAGKKVVEIPRSSSGWSFKGNCYWTYGGDIEISWDGKTYTSLDAWRKATGQEKHNGKDVGFEVDPKLVNPGGGGTIGDAHKLATLKAYQLQKSSPLIDAGLDLRELFGIDAGGRDYYSTKVPSGGGYDVGACEFSEGASSDEPICRWKFDEGGGNVAKNSGSLGCSGEGALNNMSDDNRIDWAAGKALRFDGNNDVTAGAINLNSNRATISAWIRRDGPQAAYAGIVFSRDGDTIAGIGLGSSGGPDWQPNQELYYGWNDAEGTWGFHSGLIVPDGKWVFVAVVLEPAKATLYLGEGGKISSATNAVVHSIEEFNGMIVIGNDRKPDFPPRFFKGAIDDVRIYDRALTADEIKKLAGVCK